MMDGILAKCHILISQSINSSIHNYINKQNANSSVINSVMHIIHMHFRSYQQFISTYRWLIYQLFTLLLWIVVDKCCLFSTYIKTNYYFIFVMFMIIISLLILT